MIQVGGRVAFLPRGLRPDASLPDLQVLACLGNPSVLVVPSKPAFISVAWEQGEATEWGSGGSDQVPSHHVTHWDFLDLQEKGRAGKLDRGEAEQWQGGGSAFSPCGSCGFPVGRGAGQPL